MYPIFIHVLDAQGQEDIVALNEFLACKDCISAGKGQRGPILQQSFIHLLTFSFRIIYLKEEFVLAKFWTDWRNNGFYSWGENVTESLCHLRFESKRHNTWLKTPSLPTFLKKVEQWTYHKDWLRLFSSFLQILDRDDPRCFLTKDFLWVIFKTSSKSWGVMGLNNNQKGKKHLLKE